MPRSSWNQCWSLMLPRHPSRDPFFLLANLTWGGTSKQRNLLSQSPHPQFPTGAELSPPEPGQQRLHVQSQFHGGGSSEQQARCQYRGNGKEIQKPPSCRLRKTTGLCQCHQLSHSHGRKAAPFPIHKLEVNPPRCPRTDPSSCLTSGCSINTSTLHKHQPPGPHPIIINL